MLEEIDVWPFEFQVWLLSVDQEFKMPSKKRKEKTVDQETMSSWYLSLQEKLVSFCPKLV